jgi:hypothetical protein
MSNIVWLQPCPDSVWELLPSGPEAWNEDWVEGWQYLGSIPEEDGARLRHEFRHRAHPAFADARVYAHIRDDDSGPRLARLIADGQDLELPDPVSEEA